MTSTPPPRRRGREWILFALLYVGGWILVVGVFLTFFALRGASPSELLERLPRVLRWTARNPVHYVLAALPYLAFIVTRSLVAAYRRGGAWALTKAAATRVLLPSLAVAILGLAYRAYRHEDPVTWSFESTSQNISGRSRDHFSGDGIVRGVNLVAGRPMTEREFLPLLRDNVEWIAVTPFGWQERLDATEIGVNGDAGYWSESDSGIVALARMAHDRGLRIALKPHLWVTGGATKLGDLDPGSPERWRAWFDSYRAFILRYAALAETARADLFVVGAETARASLRHPDEWRALIAATRRVYHGPLTYAANWYDEAEGLPFWDALDYIGVQAYYPLATKAGASRAELERAWQGPIGRLEALHRRWGKPVIFTEVGWKSSADAAVRPWEWSEHASQMLARPSTRAQADAYESFFRTIWREPWFKGALIWKWYGRHDRSGGADDMDFTPQNKPAEAVMAREFAQPTFVSPRERP